MTYLKTKYLVLTKDYLVPLLLFFGSIGIIYLLFFSPVFKVANFECVQDFEPCTNPFVLAELDKLKGQNIFLLNSGHAITRLQSGDFQIRDGQIKKILPSSLNLSLQSVYPVLALQLASDLRYITLDSNLRVLKITEHHPNVPVLEVNVPLSFQIGKSVPESDLSAALPFVKDVARSLPSVTNLKLSDQTLTLKLDSGITAVLTPERSVNEQISALKAVLEDATIREGVRKIDVRFAQPILARD